MATPITPVKPAPAHSSPQHQISTTTPHAVRNLVTSTQRNEDLGSSREALGKDTCEADVIPSSELLEAIYGNLKDIANIRAELEKKNLLSDRGWKALYTSEKDSYLPSESPKEEDKAFAGLAAIFEQCLCAAGINVTDCIVQFSVHGHANMETNFPNKTRPDATMHLTKSSFKWVRVHIDHGDVYLYVEFKKKNTPGNFEDDTSKLLWNVHHRFRCDPCCRFVCGLTIEDTTARFWHFSRAAVMVSEPFDIIRDADKLIHIFVSSARAKSSAELGFDPTITCTTVDPAAKQRKYKIHVSDNKDGSQQAIDSGKSRVRTFFTRRIIANYRAVGIRSRGTWVFEGSEGQQPNDTLVVIKDVWIDADREVEGTILENVRKALKDTPDELQLFLEPLCHGCVLIDGVKDLTQPLLKSKKILSLTYSEKSASLPSTSAARKRAVEELSLGSMPDPPTAEPIIIGRRGDRRKHYRIVFKGEAGHALHDLKSHQEVFTGLLGGVKALHALHKVGYIHRDLSAGNVLLVKGAEGKDHGVLIDLEYAKRFPDTSKEGHDVRTGTLQFMAVEVNARRFLFLPARRRNPLSSLLGAAAPSLPPTGATIPWFHNPIHDIESAWWMALWTFYHVNRVIGSSLFTDQSERVYIFMFQDVFPIQCSALPSTVLTLLDDWLSFMREKYAELESLLSNQSHGSFNYDHVFEVAIQFVEAIIKDLPNEQDPVLRGEELTTSADGSPTKRRKVHHSQGSS